MLYALKLFPKERNQLQAYSDAGWVGEANNARKSRSGIIIYYGEATIYISSCTQEVKALSLSEPEYMALSDTARITKWLR